MANAKTNQVIYVDTTGYTLDACCTIKAVKYIGNTSGTALITSGTSGSGGRLWEESGASNQAVEELEIRVTDGFHVAVTNSAKVYIYLE